MFLICKIETLDRNTQTPHFVIVLDSRGFRFEQKKQPSNLEISYVISRGKTVEQLYDQTVTELWWVPSDKKLSFKICAGINNFIEKEYLGAQGTEFRPSQTTPEFFIESLANIKSKLKARFPNSRVAFGTIPPVHFGELQQSRLRSGLLKTAKYSAAELSEFQDRVSAKLTLVNSEIIELNKLERVWTLGLAEIIVKHHKKSCGRSNVKSKKVTSQHFQRMYDGLHAKSHIKQKWFNLIIKACQRESEQVLSSKSVEKAASEDKKTESEEKRRCWRR